MTLFATEKPTLVSIYRYSDQKMWRVGVLIAETGDFVCALQIIAYDEEHAQRIALARLAALGDTLSDRR